MNLCRDGGFMESLERSRERETVVRQINPSIAQRRVVCRVRDDEEQRWFKDLYPRYEK